MSAAGFILAINLFVAGIFATAFGVVAAYSRTAIGARWLAFAYGLGILNAVLEFVLPMQADTRPMEVLVFSVALLAFIVAVIGLARHYAAAGALGPLSAFGLISVLVVNLLTLGLPYEVAAAHRALPICPMPSCMCSAPGSCLRGRRKSRPRMCAAGVLPAQRPAIRRQAADLGRRLGVRRPARMSICTAFMAPIRR